MLTCLSAGYEAPVAGEWDEYSRYVVDGVEIPSPVSVSASIHGPILFGIEACAVVEDDHQIVGW